MDRPELSGQRYEVSISDGVAAVSTPAVRLTESLQHPSLLLLPPPTALTQTREQIYLLRTGVFVHVKVLSGRYKSTLACQ